MSTKSILASDVTATGVDGAIATCAATGTTFQAIGTTTAGSGAATIDIEVSNNNANWLVLGTISLTLGVTATSDGFASFAAWAYVRANVTTISGTGASVSVYMAA